MIKLVPLSTVAQLAGVSLRSLQKAVKRIASGKAETWRGARLVVVPVKGRGGKGGVLHQLRVDSLPVNLQQRLEEHLKAPSTPLQSRRFQTKSDAAFDIFSRMVAEVDATRPGTVARGEVWRDWAGRELIDIKGSGAFKRYSIRSLQRICHDIKRGGLGAHLRATRSDKGKTRHIISRAWSQAVPFDETKQKEIEESLRRRIRSFLGAGYQFGQISLRGTTLLEKLTREAGFEPPHGLCRVPPAFIRSERRYKDVHTYKTDRKNFEDRQPRLPRDYSKLGLNEIWIGDCHKSDVLQSSSDKYQEHAVFITWMEASTLRVHIDVVILPKGAGITNQIMIESLKRAIKAMGVPKCIYIDNGSEYYHVDFIRDLIELARGDGEKVIVHSRPHEPQGKAVLEGFFGVFEGKYLWPAPGQLGGVREKSKIADGGRKPSPWQETHAAFFKYIEAQTHIYHHTAQNGRILRGLSPFHAYEKQIAAGATRVELDEEAFLVAFSEFISRNVDRGAIKYAGKQWICEEAIGLHKVLIRAPKYVSWDRLPVYDLNERLLGWAAPPKVYEVLDSRGAKEGARLRKLGRDYISNLARDIDEIDHVAEVREFAAALPPMPIAPSIGLIGSSDQARELQQGLKENPKTRRAREDAAREAEAAFDEDFIRRIQGANKK